MAKTITTNVPDDGRKSPSANITTCHSKAQNGGAISQRNGEGNRLLK
jgi:hypothetical protein